MPPARIAISAQVAPWAASSGSNTLGFTLTPHAACLLAARDSVIPRCSREHWKLEMCSPASYTNGLSGLVKWQTETESESLATCESILPQISHLSITRRMEWSCGDGTVAGT